jgi:hypothetical protein
VLLAVFLVKMLLVDSYTTWFRRQSPQSEVIGASHPLQVSLDDKVMLLGYDLDREVAQAGQRVGLTLYWQTLQPLEGDYNTFAHLDAPPFGTTWLAADNDPPGDPQAQADIPTSRWELDSYVRDVHRFELPHDLPPVRYTIRVGLYDPTTGQGLGEPIALRELQVLPAQPTRPSQIANRVQVHFGEQIELLGYELAAERTPTLTLYWRATEPVEQDYTVFVHMLDEHGELQDQRDGPPLQGMYPTSAWWPGQIIADQRDLPPLPGNGRILVGLYELASLDRLPAYGSDGERLPSDALPLPIGP